jgi:hypothetical protein
MAIIVKNKELNAETIEALNTLIEEDINASTAFKLMRIVKDLSSIVDDKTKLEKKILEKWVNRDKDGEPISGKNEKGEVIEGSVELKDPKEFTKEMKELSELENKLEFDKLKFDDLGLKTAKVKNLMKLEFLFE